MPQTLETDDYLSADYYPPKPTVNRNEDIKAISIELFRHERGVYLWAPKGTGKTFLSKQIMKTYPNSVYIPFSFSVPESIAEYLRATRPYMHGRLALLSSMLIEQLRGKYGKQKVLIILDDIQSVRRPKDLFLFLKGFVDGLKRDPQLTPAILLLSQFPYIKLESLLENDEEIREGVISRLQLLSLSLRRYTTDEMFSILKERFLLALESPAQFAEKEEVAVRAISGITVRHGSDVRLGLRILREWIDVGRPNNLDVGVIWEKEKFRYWADQLLSMHPHQAAVLTVLADMGGKVGAPDLYKEYDKFCKVNDSHGLDYSQFHRMLDELEKLGFIMRGQSSTRGRPYTVSLHESITIENFTKAAEQISWPARLG